MIVRTNTNVFTEESYYSTFQIRHITTLKTKKTEHPNIFIYIFMNTHSTHYASEIKHGPVVCLINTLTHNQH